MQYNDVVISKSRLLSCFDDRSNDFFRVSQIEPEEGDSAMPLSFCNFTFILNFTSFVYNNCCTSAVQTSLTALGLQIISEKYLSDALKKCANCLAVWKIRVNTHTHNRHARQYTDYFLNTNTLRRVRFLEYLSFPRYYPNLYMPPSPIGGARRHIRRRCLPEHGATMPANIADMLFY